MIIGIDIGNTNIKLGVFDGGKLVDSLRLSSSNRKTADEYYYNIKTMLAGKSTLIPLTAPLSPA